MRGLVHRRAPPAARELTIDDLTMEIIQLRASLYRIANFNYRNPMDRDLDTQQIAHDALDASLVRCPGLTD